MIRVGNERFSYRQNGHHVLNKEESLPNLGATLNIYPIFGRWLVLISSPAYDYYHEVYIKQYISGFRAYGNTVAVDGLNIDLDFFKRVAVLFLLKGQSTLVTCSFLMIPKGGTALKCCDVV